MADAPEPIRDPAAIEALAGLVSAHQPETRVICATFNAWILLSCAPPRRPYPKDIREEGRGRTLHVLLVLAPE